MFDFRHCEKGRSPFEAIPIFKSRFNGKNVKKRLCIAGLPRPLRGLMGDEKQGFFRRFFSFSQKHLLKTPNPLLLKAFKEINPC